MYGIYNIDIFLYRLVFYQTLIYILLSFCLLKGEVFHRIKAYG